MYFLLLTLLISKSTSEECPEHCLFCDTIYGCYEYETGYTPNEEEYQVFYEQINKQNFDSNDQSKIQDVITKLIEENKQLRAENAKLKSQKDKPTKNTVISDSLLYLAIDALFGLKEENSPEKAIQYLRQSSNRGNKVASYMIGSIYENGQYIDQDFQEAVKYYTKSTDQGNSFGINRIGYCYNNGYGVEINHTKSIEYLKKGIKMNNPFSFNNMGYMYSQGFGVERDNNKAEMLYMRAGELGDLNAYSNIAAEYLKKNINKSIEILEKDEFGFSYRFLGDLYYSGEYVEQNFTKALEYFHKAADLGDAEAILSIGRCYEDGNGVEKDLQKALELYEKAGKLGSGRAFCMIGLLYYGGKIQMDKNKMIEYFEKAAKLGTPEGFFNLGCCYAYGIGLNIDVVKGIELLHIAADKGYNGALKHIEHLEKKYQNDDDDDEDDIDDI